jgi:general secretion pathway protein B
MSYILDALRRADAERERGAVPRLHSPNLAAPTAAGAAGGGASGPAAARPGAPWLVPVLAGVVAVAALALAAGLWLGRGSPAGSAGPDAAGAAGTSVATAQPAAAATAREGATEVPAVVSGSAAPTPVVPPAPTVVVVPMPAPAPPPAARSPGAPAPVGGAPGTRASPAPAAGATPAPGTGAAAEAPPVPVTGLSAEQRRLWPTLAPGGSVYSDDASQRFVILNGQVLREGDSAAPGITVEAIAPRAVVLRWGGLRVELPL